MLTIRRAMRALATKLALAVLPLLAACSKPCVSNNDCYNSETGLVCDLVLPDPQFLGTLPPDVRTRYLADIAYSSYCVVPRSK